MYWIIVYLEPNAIDFDDFNIYTVKRKNIAEENFTILFNIKDIMVKFCDFIQNQPSLNSCIRGNHIYQSVERRGGVEPHVECRGGENLACEWEMSNMRESYVVIVVSICVCCKPNVPSSSLCLCAGILFLNI